MARIDSFKAGDLVVVRGIGLCKLDSTEGERWKLSSTTDKKDVVEIKLEKLDALVRPPMGAAEAGGVLAKLMAKGGEPDARDWGDQYLEHGPALKTGTPAAQADILQKLFRAEAPDEMQQRAIGKLEEVLLPELALALKKKVGALRSQLHKGQPAFGYQAPEREDDGPIANLKSIPAGWEAQQAFRVFSGKLAIGEQPSGEVEPALDGAFPNIIAPCPNGEWFPLFRNQRESYQHLLATRAAASQIDQLLARLEPLGTVGVEGGALHAVDQEVCADRRYRKAMEAGGAILGRGYEAAMGGDGDVPIAGVRSEDGLISLFAIGHFGEDADDDGEGDDEPEVSAAPPLKTFFKRLFGG